MEKERITLTDPVVFKSKKKVVRTRKRLGLTVDPLTIEKLKGLAEDGECENVSRAIDFVTEYFYKNRRALPVSFHSNETRGAFARAALQAGFTPEQMLERLAIEWLQK